MASTGQLWKLSLNTEKNWILGCGTLSPATPHPTPRPLHTYTHTHTASFQHPGEWMWNIGPTLWSPEEALTGVEGVNSPGPGGKGGLCSQVVAGCVVSGDPKPSSFFSQCPLWTRLSCVHGPGLPPEPTASVSSSASLSISYP